MGFKFPYGNEQQLNLNWFIKKFKELLADWQHEQERIDGALDAEIQRAEDALSDVYTARDVTVAAKNDALQAKADALTAAANAAQYWQNAAASANSAATSAVTALQAAQDAADDAAQTSSDRAGVAADKATVAADKATVAADKATVAADKATVAADKATVAQDKDDVDTMKDAANAAALRAEGWADGKQNGTDVGSSSPYYQNNAKYYKEQAETIVTNSDGAKAQAMIAAQENTTTASRAYAVGEYFRYNGQLYIITAPVASGETLIVGTNCEHTTVADGLYESLGKHDPNLSNNTLLGFYGNIRSIDRDIDLYYHYRSDVSIFFRDYMTDYYIRSASTRQYRSFENCFRLISGTGSTFYYFPLFASTHKVLMFQGTLSEFRTNIANYPQFFMPISKFKNQRSDFNRIRLNFKFIRSDGTSNNQYIRVLGCNKDSSGNIVGSVTNLTAYILGDARTIVKRSIAVSESWFNDYNSIGFFFDTHGNGTIEGTFDMEFYTV